MDVTTYLQEIKAGNLTLAQAEFFRDANALLCSRELSETDGHRVVYEAYKRQFGAAAAVSMGAFRMQQNMRDIGNISVLHRCTTNFDPCLDALDLSASAVPAISSCLQCHGLLCVTGYERRPTMFYDVGSAGVRGRLYFKECDTCGITYQVDGYQQTSSFRASSGVKLMYTTEHIHPFWFRSTSETVVSLSLLHMTEGGLQFAQSGFYASSNINNWVAGGGAAGSVVDSKRGQLQDRRLGEAFMAYQAQQVFRVGHPELLPNINLRLPLDAQLDMAEPLLTDDNKRRFFLHMATSTTSPWCGRFEMIDGNAKVRRSRCSALLLEPAPVGEPLADGTHIFYSKFCQETPARNDPSGCCKGCRQRHDVSAMEVDEDDDIAAAGDVLAAAGASASGDDRAAYDSTDQEHLPPIRYLTRRAALNSQLPDPAGRDIHQPDLLKRAAPVAAAAAGASSAAGSSAAAAVGGVPAGSEPAPLYDDVYAAECIEDERYDRRSRQVLYKVRWAGTETRTWEPIENIVVGSGRQAQQLYEEWCCRAVPRSVFDDDESGLLPEPSSDAPYSGPVPPVDQQQSSSQQQQPGEQSSSAGSARCKLRGEDGPGGRFNHRTGGSVWSLCACGYPQSPMELPGAEGTRAIMCYLLDRYRDHPMRHRGDECEVFTFGFDDMCHLSRFAESHKSEHPKIFEFATETRKVVDKFHFSGHVGAYCKKYCNPYSWGDALSVNMSVCEQYFSRFGRFKYTFRHMNRSRFQFMLQVVCMLDQRARDMGMI